MEPSEISVARISGGVRERIVAAALACFARDGVLTATLGDIRGEAGVSVGAVYHHFADKQALAASVYVEGMRAYQRAFIAELREHAGAQEGVRAIVVFHLRWCADNPVLARYLHTQRESAGPAADALERANRAFFADVLAWWRVHVTYDTLRDLDALVLHALWLGPSQEWCRHWLAGGRQGLPEGVADALADAAWRSLAGPASAPPRPVDAMASPFPDPDPEGVPTP